jgi:hypothetical protein
MLATLFLLILSVAVLVALLLVIVIVGIRQEPPTEELSEQPSSLVAAFVRRLLGLHVRKPGTSANLNRAYERPCLEPVTLLADPMRKPNPNER